jgi:type III secretion protein N (ATPase)
VKLDLERALGIVERAPTSVVTGKVREIVGLVMRATVPGIRYGELVSIDRTGTALPPLAAEVVGFRGDEAVLLPFGEPVGVGPDCAVHPHGQALTVRCGEALLGRVVDGLGRIIDGGGAVDDALLESWAVERPAPDPLTRQRVERPLATGVRAIDGLLTVGEGQRIGLFAGSGVGKSTLLGQIARSSSADVNVICLVGERGREVRDFIEDALGEQGLQRSVIVCATSDAPSLVRLKSTFVATAIAEWFRERRGARVLLMVDSLTRFARAQREVGLSAGEPPARQGYPPSVFAALPRLLERTGNAASGSITAIYTVLVAGSDMEEPIADEVRGIVDGHVVLDREIGARGRWPAIDVLHSVSRVMPRVADEAHLDAARRVRALLGTYEAHRDLIAVGAYKAGADARVDEAIARLEAVEAYLRQGVDEPAAFADAVAGLAALV